MKQIVFGEDTWAIMLKLAADHKIYAEGNFLKVLADNGSPTIKGYIAAATAIDRDRRRKRLEITSRIQEQNELLTIAHDENRDLLAQLQTALDEAKSSAKDADSARLEAEQARKTVEQDLDYLQRRTQFELMGNIVQVALYVIIGVGVITTVMYAFALFTSTAETEADVALLGNTWSNMFGILLTNSFSIIGTIMGVKYATDSSSNK